MEQEFSYEPPVHADKHKHQELSFLEREFERAKIVLVGNPNVGKSLIFNALSGMNAEVSNFPGTTVELTKGRYASCDLYDTPGVYGVSSFNDEERVARDIILEADCVINVVDATHLERDLFLTQQLIDMGKKLVVVLNFMDEVRKQKIVIDGERLASFLGVEVVPVVAVKKEGFDRLRTAVGNAREGIQREDLHSSLHAMLRIVGSQAEALLVLEGDTAVAERHGIAPAKHRDALYIGRRNRVNYIVNAVLRDDSRKVRISDRIGRWALAPLTGIPMLVLFLYGAYLFVGKFVAQTVVNHTEKVIGATIWEPWIRGLIANILPSTSWWSTLLVGEFGVISMTTTYLLFLLLPLVVAFYLTLAAMEDSGYLPRLATMVDRSLSGIGLNGRAVIPLILGFGCVTSATVTTRLLTSEREKTIATALLQFVVPCSAQIAVIAALLAGAGPQAMAVYIVVMLTVFVGLGTVLNKTLRGESSPLLLDLPPMRLPRVENVVRKTLFRSYQFMKEAAGWFFLGALAVAVAQLTGILEFLQRLIVPLVTGGLQLPAEAATAFIMGVVRRDFGAAGLYQMSLSPMQATVALLTITLFVPCIASLMVMMKERGMKEGMAIWIGTWVAAFAVGSAVSHIVM